MLHQWDGCLRIIADIANRTPTKHNTAATCSNSDDWCRLMADGGPHTQEECHGPFVDTNGGGVRRRKTHERPAARGTDELKAKIRPMRKGWWRSGSDAPQTLWVRPCRRSWRSKIPRAQPTLRSYRSAASRMLVEPAAPAGRARCTLVGAGVMYFCCEWELPKGEKHLTIIDFILSSTAILYICALCRNIFHSWKYFVLSINNNCNY